jgi:hypothetical protein
MRTVRTKNTEIGHFVLYREEKNMDFVCDRCLRPKTAKIRVQWTDRGGITRSLCNGCYGYLIAKPREGR